MIIPFRCENKSTYYIVERLKDLLGELPRSLPIEFIVVDSGSAPEYQKECREICRRAQAVYLFHNTVGQVFSIGACRDFGVQHAHGKAVSFFDVDLRVAPDFWQRLLQLMTAWGISKYKKSFLAVPCLYLTQEGTVDFLSQDKPEKYLDFYLRYLQGDKTDVENLALCSSVMVVNRHHYLAVGGHDKAFRGHGYEDFELYHRLLCEENIIPKTDDYFLDQKTWNTYTYKGFRSHLAMIGRPALMQGLFVVHLWHPRPRKASFYTSKNTTANREIWVDKFKQFIKNQKHPLPLIEASHIQNKTLFFGTPTNITAHGLKDIFPMLGQIFYINEHGFMDASGNFLAEEFAEMLSNEKITHILFPNPYGNPARLAVYQWCNQNGFPYYCYERGALPDSWFFDTRGCNGDSGSYHPKYWNKILSDQQKQDTQAYIQECISGVNVLEKQSDRIGGDNLAEQLNTGGKRVLFVPLQRPSDTVIKYLAGNIQSYERFIQLIDKLAERLLHKGWLVFCKKHPLETTSPTLKFAQYVPENTHFIDLLEMADRVALINSGVGVYSMMMHKPTYIFGNAFYAVEEVNRVVPYLDILDDAAVEALAKQIVAGFEVDADKVQKFIHYLIAEFYSFGKPRTTSRKEADGSLRTITTDIDFYSLRLNRKTVFEYEKTPRPALSLSAPMFERYGLDLHLKRQQAAKKSEAATPNKPVAAKPAPAKPAPAKPAATKPAPTKSEPAKPEPPKPKPAATVKTTDAPKTAAKPPAQLPESTAAVLRTVAEHKASKNDAAQRKWNKLRRDPYRFFADSKNPVLHPLKHLFKSGE